MSLILEIAIIIISVFGVEYYKRAFSNFFNKKKKIILAIFTCFSTAVAFITSLMLKASIAVSFGTGLKVGIIVAAILILMNTNLVNFKKIFEKMNIFKKFFKK